MNAKSKHARLAELSHLWTSGEWTLHRVHRSLARVFFLFPAGRPSLNELIAVRAIIPKFSNSTISLLKTEVGKLNEFAVGEFGGIEARRLEAEAQARGLTVRMEDTSDTGYLPVSTQGTALIIEDNELAALATEEMLRRDVPVVAHEEHD